MGKQQYLIVGGTSGIGRALVKTLSGEGHELIVMGRRERPDELPQDVRYLRCNVLSEDLDSLTIADNLQGMAYFPGSITLKPFSRTSEATLEEDLDINLKGAFRVLQAVEDALKSGESPSNAVFFSTVAAEVGLKYHASIAAAKAGLEGLVKSVAAEWAPTVRLNLIAPSLTETPLAEKLLDSDSKRERSLDRHPTRSINKPAEVAKQARLLLEGDLNVTGRTIPLDGGMATVRTK
ncbi:MAG: SDR family NAD(P)-dependent oxidoreductase [bacterium]